MFMYETSTYHNHFIYTTTSTLFSVLLAELESHQDAWPFLTPVNHKAVPGYRKVIKKPMDFSTIREKLTNNQYVYFTGVTDCKQLNTPCLNYP